MQAPSSKSPAGDHHANEAQKTEPLKSAMWAATTQGNEPGGATSQRHEHCDEHDLGQAKCRYCSGPFTRVNAIRCRRNGVAGDKQEEQQLCRHRDADGENHGHRSLADRPQPEDYGAERQNGPCDTDANPHIEP